MGSSFLFESSDADSPVLYDSLTGFINLLDKVLVDGYGTKEGLGWEKAYSDLGNTITAYRNKGTGFYLVVYADSNYASTGSAVKIETYEVMTAYNVGFLRTPEAGVNHYFCFANTKVGTRSLSWKIIGDDKGFWIATQYSTTAGLWTVSYFGDYIPFHISNKTNWISFTPITVEVSTTHMKSRTTTLNNDIRVTRDYLNNLPPQKVLFMNGTGVVDSDTSYQIGRSSFTSPINIFSTPVVGAGNMLYGCLPGLYEPLNSIDSESVTVYSGNQSIITLSLNENAGRVGILVGEGFRP